MVFLEKKHFYLSCLIKWSLYLILKIIPCNPFKCFQIKFQISPPLPLNVSYYGIYTYSPCCETLYALIFTLINHFVALMELPNPFLICYFKFGTSISMTSITFQSSKMLLFLIDLKFSKNNAKLTR